MDKPVEAEAVKPEVAGGQGALVERALEELVEPEQVAKSAVFH